MNDDDRPGERRQAMSGDDGTGERREVIDPGEWDSVEDEGVLDSTDTLDNERVPDPLDVGLAPPDHWSAAIRYGTTPAEQHAGESLAQLLREEEPDVDPYAAGAESTAEDEDELTRRDYESEPRAGRLVTEDRGFEAGEEADAVAHDTGIDAGAATAEEAAMHVTEDPSGPGAGPLG